MIKDYKVFYGIPTYTQFKLAEEAVFSVLNSTLVPDQIAIIDNSETGAGYVALQHLQKYANVHIIPRAVNILSGAWNDIMNLYCEDYIIIANDDVMPHKHSIEALVTAAIDNPHIAMFNGSGHSGNSYSFFLLRKWAYEQVGRFNERFKPAYFEDNDYDYRLRILAGLIRDEVPTATFDHIGSATVKNMSDEERLKSHNTFRRLRALYINMWGGEPGKERFKEPFMGLDLSDL